jgi:hypothetical protein
MECSQKKKNSSWQCPSDSALHWWLLANSNTHPTGGTYQCWAGIKNALEYHLVTIQLFPTWNFQGINFTDTLIEPLITGSNLYEKYQTNENWIQRNKFKYWDPRDKTPYSGQVLKIECTRFNAQSLNKVRTNYSSCTARSSENTCSNSGGAQEKGKTGWNLVFCVSQLPFMLMYIF